MLTEIRDKLKFLLRLIWQAGLIGQAVTVIGLLLSLLSLLAKLFGYTGGLPWWLGLAIGVPLILGAAAWAAASRAYDLEEAARPCLIFGEVSEVERPHKLHGTVRQFEIEIANDSAAMLDECLVNLTRIEPQDQSVPSVDHCRALCSQEEMMNGMQRVAFAYVLAKRNGS